MSIYRLVAPSRVAKCGGLLRSISQRDPEVVYWISLAAFGLESTVMACQLGERVKRTLADIAVMSLLREERLMFRVAAIGHGRLSLVLVLARLFLYVKVDFGNRFATRFSPRTIATVVFSLEH